MYNIQEFFKEDGEELKEVLKACICGYYKKNSSQITNNYELDTDIDDSIIKNVNKTALPIQKGENKCILNT